MKLISIDPIAIGYTNPNSISGIFLKFLPYIPAIRIGKELQITFKQKQLHYLL